MATNPTNNAVPSEAPRDLKFNAGKIDEIVNSSGDSFSDRFGRARMTWAGIEKITLQSLLSYGYVPVRSFEDGAQITTPNQILLFEQDGNYYRWDGSLPKEVTAGSTPESSGGIGIGAWVSVADAALRSELASSSGAGLISYKYPSSDSVSRTLESHLADVASVKDFGAKGDGITDDTSSFQDAFNSGKKIFIPVGRYKVTDHIIATNGQIIQGSGRLSSVFVITTDFNMSARAVISLGTEGSSVAGGDGAQIFDVGFEFEQADQGIRDNCTKYPWAINIHSLPRSVIDRVRISSAWRGIDATGNPGGSYIGFIEVGALLQGIYIDGAADFLHGGHWHFWPFGMAGTTNLKNVFYDTVGRAAIFGYCDGLNVDTLSSFEQAIEVVSTASDKGIPITINKMLLDSTASCLLMSYGYMYIDSLYNTSGNAAYPCVSLSGSAKLIVSKFSGFTGRTQATLRTQDSAILEVNGGYVYDIQVAYPFAACYGTSQMSLNNMIFDHGAQTLTQPKVYQADGTATLRVNNCNWRNTGSASGTAIQFSAGTDNSCLTNTFTGTYGVVVPASTSSSSIAGIYKDIYSASTSPIYANDIIGNIKARRLTATTSGSQLSIAHGVPSLQLKVVSCQAFYQDASGATIPATVAAIDGGNIYVTTGSAVSGRPVKVIVQYLDSSSF